MVNNSDGVFLVAKSRSIYYGWRPSGPLQSSSISHRRGAFSYFFCKWMPYAIFHYTDFTLGTVIKSFPVVLFSTAVALVVITTVSRYRPLHPSPNPLFPQKLINHSNSVQTFHNKIWAYMLLFEQCKQCKQCRQCKQCKHCLLNSL